MPQVCVDRFHAVGLAFAWCNRVLCLAVVQVAVGFQSVAEVLLHRCEQAAPDFSPGLKRASTHPLRLLGPVQEGRKGFLCYTLPHE